MNTTQQTLTRIYSDILSHLSLHRSREQDPEYAKLSGLFLPGTSQAYQQEKRRIEYDFTA